MSPVKSLSLTNTTIFAFSFKEDPWAPEALLQSSLSEILSPGSGLQPRSPGTLAGYSPHGSVTGMNHSKHLMRNC